MKKLCILMLLITFSLFGYSSYAIDMFEWKTTKVLFQPTITNANSRSTLINQSMITKKQACVLSDGPHLDKKISDIDIPGAYVLEYFRMYKRGSTIYFTVSINYGSPDVRMYAYNCINDKMDMLVDIKSQLPNHPALPNAAIEIYAITDDAIWFDVYRTYDGAGYNIGFYMYNFATNNIVLHSLDTNIWDPLIREDYNNFIELMSLVSGNVYVVKVYDKLPVVLSGFNATSVKKLPFETYKNWSNKYFENNPVQYYPYKAIQIINEQGDGYISLASQLELYPGNSKICKDTIDSGKVSVNTICLDGENYGYPVDLLPRVFMPFNIFAGTVDTNKVYETIGHFEVNRLYRNGLTQYNNTYYFHPTEPITREQAAKFMGQFATTILKKEGNSSNNCEFTDINKVDKTLVQDVLQACKLGLFKGFNGKFNPKNELIYEEAVTVLVRMLYGMQNESIKPWYTNYMATAKNNGLILHDGIGVNLGKSIKRGEIGQMLYEAGQKYIK